MVRSERRKDSKRNFVGFSQKKKGDEDERGQALFAPAYSVRV